ncbi:MAG: GtrA family protein [Actinomycetia bacterium]|nr:GtrA family protein [Actinomycetes bacterium]
MPIPGGRFLTWWKTFGRYLVQGFGLNLFGIALFAMLISIFPGLSPVYVNVATSCLIFPLSYLANRIWVFNARGPMGPQIRRFVVVYCAAATVSLVTFVLLWQLLPVGAVAIQVIVVGLVVIGTFLLNLTWTFVGS